MLEEGSSIALRAQGFPHAGEPDQEDAHRTRRLDRLQHAGRIVVDLIFFDSEWTLRTTAEREKILQYNDVAS